MIPIAAFPQATDAASGVVWWSALAVIIAAAGAGLWRVLTVGAKVVRMVTAFELSLDSLTGSVRKLALSDEVRSKAATDVSEQIRSLTQALRTVADLETSRYQEHGNKLTDHEERLVSIEHVPVVRRAL